MHVFDHSLTRDDSTHCISTQLLAADCQSIHQSCCRGNTSSRSWACSICAELFVVGYGGSLPGCSMHIVCWAVKCAGQHCYELAKRR